jgi:opacity protein-like surface antigen
LKKSIKVCLLGPVVFIMAGFGFLSPLSAQERPNIRTLTSEDTAQKAQTGQIREESPSRSSSSRTISNLNSHYFGVGVGQTFLQGDMRYHGDDRLGYDLMYVYTASLSFDFMANLHTQSHRTRNEKVRNSGLALGIKGRFYQYDNFAPFVVGGFGFYRPKVRRVVNDVLVSSEAKMTFGNHLGLGAELKLNRRVTVGALLHWHNPFNVQQDNGPAVKGAYTKLMMTALYSF